MMNLGIDLRLRPGGAKINAPSFGNTERNAELSTSGHAILNLADLQRGPSTNTQTFSTFANPQHADHMCGVILRPGDRMAPQWLESQAQPQTAAAPAALPQPAARPEERAPPERVEPAAAAEPPRPAPKAQPKAKAASNKQQQRQRRKSKEFGDRQIKMDLPLSLIHI
mgnify:CR=1 FL=1